MRTLRCLALASIVVGGCKHHEPSLAVLHSDHIDGPATSQHSITDISDLYVFPTPGKPDFVTVVLNVHPLSREHNHFSDKVDYDLVFRELSLARESGFASDPRSERKISCRFTTPDDHTQHRMSCRFAELGEHHSLFNDARLQPAPADIRAFHGLRADPFFFNAEFATALAQEGKLLTTSGENTMDKTNILTVILQFNVHELFGKRVKYVGVVAQSRTLNRDGTRGRDHLLDRLGRPEVTNVTLVARGEAEDIRDEFNLVPVFATLTGQQRRKFESRIVENLLHYDAVDSKSDWTRDQKEQYARLIVDDWLVFDASVQTPARYFAVESQQLFGAPGSQFGGRGIDDDIMDTLFGVLINRGQKAVSDRVDRPYKTTLTAFPYLAKPDSSWAGWAKAKLARWKLGLKENE